MHRSSTVYKQKQIKTVTDKYVGRFCLKIMVTIIAIKKIKK